MNIIKRLRKWILRGLDAEVALLELRVRDQEKSFAEYRAGIVDESYPHRDLHHRCDGCERYDAGRCTRHDCLVRPVQWCAYWCERPITGDIAKRQADVIAEARLRHENKVKP